MMKTHSHWKYKNLKKLMIAVQQRIVCLFDFLNLNYISTNICFLYFFYIKKPFFLGTVMSKDMKKESRCLINKSDEKKSEKIKDRTAITDKLSTTFVLMYIKVVFLHY